LADLFSHSAGFFPVACETFEQFGAERAIAFELFQAFDDTRCRLPQRFIDAFDRAGSVSRSGSLSDVGFTG
jgi:hypothetical protein